MLDDMLYHRLVKTSKAFIKELESFIGNCEGVKDNGKREDLVVSAEIKSQYYPHQLVIQSDYHSSQKFRYLVIGDPLKNYWQRKEVLLAKTHFYKHYLIFNMVMICGKLTTTTCLYQYNAMDFDGFWWYISRELTNKVAKFILSFSMSQHRLCIMCVPLKVCYSFFT